MSRCGLCRLLFALLLLTPPKVMTIQPVILDPDIKHTEVDSDHLVHIIDPISGGSTERRSGQHSHRSVKRSQLEWQKESQQLKQKPQPQLAIQSPNTEVKQLHAKRDFTDQSINTQKHEMDLPLMEPPLSISTPEQSEQRQFSDQPEQFHESPTHAESLELDYLNPFIGSPKYAGKKICRSKNSWADVTQPWSLLSARLGQNCSLIYGNLVIAGLTDADSISDLEQIEEISGYLVIHSVGRTVLRLPNLRLIRGHEFVQVKNRRVSLLVSSNYLVQTKSDQTAQSAMDQQFSFLRTLEIPRLISIVQHGVYFYDNPGLCYAPFTLKWADLLESAELQTVDLYPVHSQANVTRWLIYCHCQYSDSCKSSELDVTRTSWTDRPLLEINSGTTAADWDYHQTDVGKQSDLPHLETVSDVEATPLDTELPSFVTESNIYRVKRRILVSEEQAISPARTTESSEVIVFQENEAVNTEKKVLDTEKSASQLPITVITLHDQIEQTIIDPLTPESSSSSESTGNSKPEIVMKLIEPQSIDVSQEEISSVEEPVRVQLLVPRSPEKTQQKHDERKSMSEAIETDEKLEPLTTTGPAEETESNIKESYVLDESSTEQPKYVESIFNGELKPNKSVIKNIESYLFSDFRVSSPKMPMFNHSTLRLNQSETVQQMLDSLRMLCHPKCPQIHGTRYCWGPELNQCQAIHKCQIRLCDGSNWCYRDPTSGTHSTQHRSALKETDNKLDEYCCHTECAAGCSGPRSTDCNACLRHNLNGSCVAVCPATRVYDKSTYTWKNNPHGRLSFGWTCVEQCPTNYLRDGDNCVSHCGRPGTFPRNGQCVSCSEAQCPKSCSFSEIETVKGIDYLRRSSLRAMENCTTFHGDIKLSRQSFVGDPFHNITRADEGVRWSDLVQGLSGLREVTGILYISAGSDAPWLNNLTFLSKLEVIGGVSPHVLQARTININSNQHLEFLGLTSLRTIAHPTILITGNPNLCFTESIQWDSFVPTRSNLAGSNALDADNQAPYAGVVRTSRVKREPYLALRERIQNEIERRLLQNLLSQLPGKSNRPRSYSIPTIFVHGNAHPEFCRGKSASCARQCVTEMGCWGPGPFFCRECRHWSVPRLDGTRLCVDQCEHVPGYFTPSMSNAHAYVPTPSTTTPVPIGESARAPDDPIRTESLSTITANVSCGTCSVNCRLENNACYGPGSDQCILPCRWVKDGPYCREMCPSGKFEDPVSRICHECDSVCSVPLGRIDRIPLLTTEVVNGPAEPNRAVCTGPGNWPGQGGCNYCRQTALRETLDKNNKLATRLECVETCPSDTYLHVVNLHYRGGSSTRSLAVVHTMNSWQSQSRMHHGTSLPWSHTDAVLFERFPREVQLQLASWLHNHTQPKLYGVARVCLPCHEQCARDPTGAKENKSSVFVSARASICLGPGPEQCMRCANASYMGRCVSHCPEGTYEIPRWQQFTSSESGQNMKELFVQISEAYMTAAVIDHSMWIRQMFHWHECLSCHSLCHSGCSGPSATQCHRCRVVKIYLNRAKTSWRCGFTCPILYKYQVRDHHTGDLVCSTRADRIRVFVDSASNKQEDGSSDKNQTHSVDSNELGETDTRFDSIQQYNVHFYLSGETAGTLAASAACFVFLLALSGLIYWAVMQQPSTSEPEFAEWFDKKQGQTSWSYRMSRTCERLWTRGRPRAGISQSDADGSRQALLNPAGQLRLMREKKYSQTMPESWSRSDMFSDAADYSMQNVGTVNYLDMFRGRDKPNMATLRIITESQLIRGPLIGSGAFGTVFCGIWRPQQVNATKNGGSSFEPGLISNSQMSLSPCTLSTSVSVVEADWPDRLEVSWTESGRVLRVRTQSREIAPLEIEAAGSATTPTEPTVNRATIEIPVAIKVLTDTADAQTNKELLEEAKVMATVDHPCCLRFLALCLTSRLQLVTQYMPLGSLLDFIKTRCDLVEVHTLMRWAHQIASGMAYLAMRGIIHRDLAARNVLVESLEQVRITDFGLAKCLEYIESEYHASGGRMPIKWLAIESIQDRIFSSKSDVWAYGVTVWEMCTFGRKPYGDIRARDLLGHLERGIRLPQPETVSLEFYSVLLQCWDADPTRRPNFTDLCMVMERLSQNPSRYLFLTARIKAQQKARANRSASDEALEFLTNTLSTCPSTQTTDSSVATTPAADSTAETEYLQMQFEWMRTLYVNSRVTTFPKCVQNLIDNNYTYLAQEPPPSTTQLVQSRNSSPPTATQPYCSLIVNPVRTTERPSVTRPQTLALQVAEQQESATEEGKVAPIDPLQLTKNNNNSREPSNLILSNALAIEKPRVAHRSSSRSPIPVHLERVEEEDSPFLTDQVNEVIAFLECAGNANNTSSGKTSSDVDVTEMDNTSDVPGSVPYVRLEDYLEPRSQAN